MISEFYTFLNIIFVTKVLSNEPKIHYYYPLTEIQNMSLNNFQNISNIDVIFPDKTSNVHQYSFKLSIFEDPPYAVLLNDSLVSGISGHYLDAFCKILNASYKIMEKPAKYNLTKHNGRITIQLFSELTDGLIDMSMNFRKLPTEIINSAVGIVYPYEMENVCVLVPKSKKLLKLEVITAPLDTYVWILLIVLITTFSIILKRLSKNATFEDYFKLFLNFCVMLVQQSVPMRNTLLINLIKTIWIWFSFFIITGYISTITSLFLNPPYGPNINTLDELIDSNISLQMEVEHFFIRNFTKYIRHRNRKYKYFYFENVNTGEYIKLINSSHATILKENLARAYIDSIDNIENGSLKMHLMENCLCASLESIPTQKRWGLTDKMSEIVLWIRESGLHLHWMSRLSDTHGKFVPSVEIDYFSFEDYVLFMQILVILWVFAILVFVCELYWKSINHISQTLKTFVSRRFKKLNTKI